jgi:hypothetical protein
MLRLVGACDRLVGASQALIQARSPRIRTADSTRSRLSRASDSARLRLLRVPDSEDRRHRVEVLDAAGPALAAGVVTAVVTQSMLLLRVR